MIRVDNLSKPDNRNWQKVSNYFLYTLPLYLVSLMALPISDDLKLWLNFGLTMLTVSLKGFSKFTTNSEDV
jgi:hypothetical protein